MVFCDWSRVAGPREEWKLICEIKLQVMLDSSNMEGRARLLPVSAKDAGGRIGASPVIRICLILTRSELRVGDEICQPHFCVACSAPFDELDQHDLGCTGSVGHHPRRH